MRNATIFQQDFLQPLKCLILAKKLSAEWSIRTLMSVDEFFQGSFFTPTHKLHFIRWHPSTPGTTKLNFDGSLQGKSAAGGYILRDWRGEILLLGAANYGHTSVVMAESRALRDGLQAALERGYSRLDIEEDSSVVIGGSKKEIEVSWRIKNVIHDIQTLTQNAEHVRSGLRISIEKPI